VRGFLLNQFFASLERLMQRIDLARRMLTVSTLAWALVPGRSASAQDSLPDESDARLVHSEDTEPRVPVAFEGLVLEPNGAPAEGAVVVSSAGGRAVTDWNGHYRLEAQVSPDAESVRITAAGCGNGNPLATKSVGLSALSGLVRLDPLWLALGSTCQPSWLPTFGRLPGIGGSVLSLTVYDDGSGPALYAGGYFGNAGGVPASGLARWDGSSWTGVGGGVSGLVRAMTVYDDGRGPALYVGGFFRTAGGVPANNIARWNGSSWQSLGGGTNGEVLALKVYDDGRGPALYVGGQFTIPTLCIAR